MWARWVSDFERGREHGEIGERFDATMLALALNSIIVTPYLTPTVTKLMTGLDPDDASFKRRQLALVRSLLESLAPSAASGEDVHTGLNVMRDGWSIAYVPIVLSTGICP